MPVALSVGRGCWVDGVWYVDQDRMGSSYTYTQGVTEPALIADFQGPISMELVIEVSSNLLSQPGGSVAMFEVERLYRGSSTVENGSFQGSVNPFQVTATAVGVRVRVLPQTVQPGEVVIATVAPRSWPSWMRPSEARGRGCTCCRCR